MHVACNPLLVHIVMLLWRSSSFFLATTRVLAEQRMLKILLLTQILALTFPRSDMSAFLASPSTAISP